VLVACSRSLSRRRLPGIRGAAASPGGLRPCGRSRRARRRRVRAELAAPFPTRSGGSGARLSEHVAAPAISTISGIQWPAAYGGSSHSATNTGDLGASATRARTGRDLRLHLGDDGAASCRHAQQVGPREDALLNLVERVRVEGDGIGAGCAQLVDVVGGDGRRPRRGSGSGSGQAGVSRAGRGRSRTTGVRRRPRALTELAAAFVPSRGGRSVRPPAAGTVASQANRGSGGLITRGLFCLSLPLVGYAARPNR
jgi:hypothetical protein